jgi:hypothetical protein
MFHWNAVSPDFLGSSYWLILKRSWKVSIDKIYHFGPFWIGNPSDRCLFFRALIHFTFKQIPNQSRTETSDKRTASYISILNRTFVDVVFSAYTSNMWHKHPNLIEAFVWFCWWHHFNVLTQNTHPQPPLVQKLYIDTQLQHRSGVGLLCTK